MCFRVRPRLGRWHRI
ncbi:hypothetical protein F383_27113 [Gossypium arboreum]|uniref:Uncharacterized protein n=1 Tax=Gossypium arboreum TaxID=29729 RepID=A0A0B0PBA5_GOSAR|nr:hypothetical protein F383_27113 [Gossypium arboreum]